MMSPEERAEKVFKDFGSASYYRRTTESVYREIITAAIREAVADERDACKSLIRESLARRGWAWQEPNPDGWCAMADEIERKIDARSEKVSPDVVKGDEVTSTE